MKRPTRPASWLGAALLSVLVGGCDLTPYAAVAGHCSSIEAELTTNRGWSPGAVEGGTDGRCLVATGGWYADEEGALAFAEPLVALNLYTETHDRLRLYLRPSSFAVSEEELEVIDFPPELWGERQEGTRAGQAFGRINYDGYTSTEFDLAMLGPDLRGPTSEVRVRDAQWALSPGEEGHLSLELVSVDFVQVGSASIAAVSGNVELGGTIRVTYEAEALQ